MKDKKYIQRCIQLAKLGEGLTYPNPMVGCVIVSDGKIIGEGWHQKAGEPHAEINAICSVKNKALLQNATLYVSLEPCAHYGKTPPCSLTIIKHKIPKVVIGCIDSFSEVNGQGIQLLKDAGIEVKTPVLEKKSLNLNKRFFTFHAQKRPYIVLKWAQSANNCIDYNRTISTLKNSKINWITGTLAKQYSHQLRYSEQAILVGKNTVKNDDPQLTIRDIANTSITRIVIDKDLEIPNNATIFNSAEKTIIFNQKKEVRKEHIHYIKLDFKNTIIPQLLNILYNLDIQSLIVEGGAYTIQQFIDYDIWDEAFVFEGNVILKNGLKAPQLKNNSLKKEQKIGADQLKVYTNNGETNL